MLGKELGHFCRGDFFAVLAPVKRGKSFWLWDIAHRGCLNGLNVIFFSLEMTYNQVVRRAWQSIVAQPIQEKEVKIPYFEEIDKKYEIKYREEKRKGIDIEKIEQEQKKLMMYSRGNLRIEVFPAGSATMDTLDVCLSNLEYYENFTPDVIVIDYADIIKGRIRDYRQQLNEIWIRLRGWAQEKNCLVVTASQTSKQAFTRDARMGDVAEDMRKLATVTKMIALNQTKSEKEAGALRIEPLLYRDGRLNGQQICVLESRDIGRVYLDSRLKKDVIDYENGNLNEEEY